MPDTNPADAGCGPGGRRDPGAGDVAHLRVRRLLRRCLDLADAGRREGAAAAWLRLIRRFRASGRPGIRGWIGEAHGRGRRPGVGAGRGDGAWIALCRRVARHLDGNGHLLLRELAAGAGLALADDLARRRRFDEAAELCGELAARFGDAESPALRALLRRARRRRRRHLAALWVRAGMNLRVLGRHVESIAELRKTVRRFGASGDPALRVQVARALYAWGWSLDRLGRGAPAAVVLGGLIRRFGAAAEPALQKRVVLARIVHTLIRTKRMSTDWAISERRCPPPASANAPAP